MRVWKTGERVRITFLGRTVDGSIKLASSNGASVFLEFEAILGGYAGGMPIFCDEDGCRDLVTGQPVVLA